MNQTELDHAVDKARREYQKYRDLNWVYFHFRGRVDPNTGKQCAPPDHTINRENNRLFEAMREAERLAWVGPTRAEDKQ